MGSKHACPLLCTEALSSYAKTIHYTSILDDSLGQSKVTALTCRYERPMEICLPTPTQVIHTCKDKHQMH